MATFSDDKIKTVWQNATTVEDTDPNKYRQDVCGAWMAWDNYGKQSPLGWEIDHILPVAKGGTDHTDNLRALQWENNKSKADDFPTYKSAVTAEDLKNVSSVKQFTVHETTIRQLKKIYPTLVK